MAFEGLTEKLSAAFKKLRGKGRLSEADVKEAMKEIRMALLEADVNFKVVKQFVAAVTERAVGTDVLESLTPAQMIVKIVNEELTALMGGESTKLTISSRPPTVVAVKSPMAWMELMANNSPMATQEAGSNFRPKCRGSGRANQAAFPTSAKLTMPKQSATA